eukprot:COSAG02_NODE_10645_length_1892_cov_2.208031_1_plen_149_part_10
MASSAQMTAQMEDLQEVHLAMFQSQWAGGDALGLVARSVEAEAVANSRAGERDPIAAATVKLFLKFPLLMSGDFEQFGSSMLARNMALRSAVESQPDAVMRRRCGLMLYSWGLVSDLAIMQPTFSWETIYGKDASVLLDVANSYDYDLD